MRMLATLCCLALLTMTSFPLMGQGVFDTTRAQTMKRVWTMTVKGMSPYSLCYLQNFGGQQGFHILTTWFRVGRGNVLWRTSPRVDTTNLFDWPATGEIPHIYEVDYDGVPPYEYVNSNSVVWQCPSTAQALPLTPIDTLELDNIVASINPPLSADLDGDGYLDLLTINNDVTSSRMARVVMGGPLGSKGIRVADIDKPGYRREMYLKAFFRSATGGWRIIQHEKNPYDLTSWLILYDMEFYRRDGYMYARATKRDSLHGSWTTLGDQPFYTSLCVSDTVARKDWFIVHRRPDYQNPYYTLIERYDITGGQFLSVEQLDTYRVALSEAYFGNSLGMEHPVVMVNEYLCYADNLHVPFAKLPLPEMQDAQDPTYRGSTTTLTAINDQTGDGRPDILGTISIWSRESGGYTNTTLVLYTLDPAVSVDDDPAPPPSTAARIVGDALELTLAVPASVSVSIAGIDGREASLLASTLYPEGTTRIDLGPVLWSYPRGAYFVRVRIGDTLHTVHLIR